MDILAVSIALPRADLSPAERESEYDVWYSAFLPKDPEAEMHEIE